MKQMWIHAQFAGSERPSILDHPASDGFIGREQRLLRTPGPVYPGMPQDNAVALIGCDTNPPHRKQLRCNADDTQQHLLWLDRAAQLVGRL